MVCCRTTSIFRGAFAICACVFVVLLLPSVANAQQQVAAMAASRYMPELRIGNRSVGRLAEVDCVIERYEGGWIWIRNGSGQVGWLKRGDAVPLSEAVGYFTQKIRAEPRIAEWYELRSHARWKQKSDLAMALGDITEAIRLAPINQSAHNRSNWFNCRGLIYEAQNDHDHALLDYNTALRLDPANGSAWNNAGVARSRRGDYQKALDNWAQVIRLDPKDATPHNNRAWIWATCRDARYRDGQRAVESARRACELTDWQYPQWLGTLAAAYAEAGDFENAVKFQKRALGLLPADSPLREENLRNFKLFEADKPVRE